MADLNDLPPLNPKKKAKGKGIAVTKRAPGVGDAKATEQKKQKLVPGLGVEKKSPEKIALEKPPSKKEKTTPPSSSVPFQFNAMVRPGVPILTTDSIRANPRLGFAMLHGVCLPEDMKQIPADLEGNIVDLFSHMALVSSFLEMFKDFPVYPFTIASLLSSCRHVNPPLVIIKSLSHRWLPIQFFSKDIETRSEHGKKPRRISSRRKSNWVICRRRWSSWVICKRRWRS